MEQTDDTSRDRDKVIFSKSILNIHMNPIYSLENSVDTDLLELCRIRRTPCTDRCMWCINICLKRQGTQFMTNN